MRSELGSMRERKKGVWEVRISLGYDSSGKYRTKSKTIRGTKKDARIALNTLLAEYGHGASGDITLQAFCHDVYMPWHRKEYQRKDSTQKLEYTINRICAEMPVKPLNSLSKAFLITWCSSHQLWMQNRLRAVLNKAVEWEYLERNPMKGSGRIRRYHLNVDTIKPPRSIEAARGKCLCNAYYLVPTFGIRRWLERIREVPKLCIFRIPFPYYLYWRVKPYADLPPIESPRKFDALLGRSVNTFHYNVTLRQMLQKISVIARDMTE